MSRVGCSKLHPRGAANCGARRAGSTPRGDASRGLPRAAHLLSRSRAPTPRRPGRDRRRARRGRATCTSSKIMGCIYRARLTGRSLSAPPRRRRPAHLLRSRHHRPRSLLHVLYEQLVKSEVTVYEEWFALDLVMDGERCGPDGVGSRPRRRCRRGGRRRPADNGQARPHVPHTNAYASPATACGVAWPTSRTWSSCRLADHAQGERRTARYLRNTDGDSVHVQLRAERRSSHRATSCRAPSDQGRATATGCVCST